MIRQPSIPYFNPIFEGLSDQDGNTQAAFGRHVHWGYWHDPAQFDGSPEAFGEGAETLSRLICETAGVANGKRLIDVGCGFGGTIASLNERYDKLDMVGLNIDSGQLALASQLVQPRDQNAILFIEGDANRIPCQDRNFDIVLAVESIFHFDRARFFAEVKRLLVSGGRFTLSDFLMSERASRYLGGFDLFGQQEILHSYGMVDLSYSIPRYLELAESNGLVLDQVIDITENTLPTYDFLLSTNNGMPESWQEPSFVKSTRMLQKASRQGLLTYQILSFSHAEAAGTSLSC